MSAPAQPADTTATAATPAVPAAPGLRELSGPMARALGRDAWAAATGYGGAWKREPSAMAATILLTALALWCVAQFAPVLAAPRMSATGPEAEATAAAMATAAVFATATADPWPGPPQTGDAGAADVPASVARWADAIASAVAEHPAPGMSVRLIGCMMRQESGGNNAAVSTAGATGLMQIHPPSHPDYDVARGAREPEYNIGYGVAYMASLLRATGGSVSDALCRYNGGGNCWRYAESQRYVRAILPCATGA